MIIYVAGHFYQVNIPYRRSLCRDTHVIDGHPFLCSLSLGKWELLFGWLIILKTAVTPIIACGVSTSISDTAVWEKKISLIHM